MVSGGGASVKCLDYENEALTEIPWWPSGSDSPLPLLLLPLLLSHFSHVQLCATHTDGSPPGSPVPGILQAKTLEWVAISFSTEGGLNLWLGY